MKLFLSRCSEKLIALLKPARVAIVIIVGAFVWFFILGDQGVWGLRKLTLMRRELSEQKTSLTANLEQLSEEKTLLEKPENLEMVIRTELGAIKPGEVIFQEKSNDEGKKVKNEDN